jgi:hypothetical protein
MLVLPNSQGMSVIPVLTEMTHLFGALQDPSSLTATGVAMDVMVGPSLLGSEGGGGSAHPRRPSLGLSCRCPLGMHMVLSIVYVAPASLVFVPELKKVISGWQGSYLDNSDCSSACCVLGDTP